MMTRRAVSAGDLQVRFWGVRGSTCASGPQFVEYGSHTPCVEVRCGDRLFIIDAGSGLAALGSHLGNNAPDTVDILFSHLHLDHISGLPFFKPALLSNDRVIRTFCGNLDGDSAEDSLARIYSPPLFPISLDQLPAQFEHHGFKAGDTLAFADGTRVATHLLNHPGGSTGYRFTHAGRSLCYISDIEHADPWPDPGLLEFVRDCDLMIYDGMFSDAEYTRCQGWGHSTWHKGVELAKAAGVGALAIFHIFPGHDDAFLNTAEAEMQTLMPKAFVARERQSLSFAPVGDADRSSKARSSDPTSAVAPNGSVEVADQPLPAKVPAS